MMRIKAHIALGAGLLIGLTSMTLPASATPTSEVLTERTGLVASDPETDAVRRLNALVGTQTDEEIDTIATSGRPVELLVDDNDEVIAAYYVETAYATAAISPTS